MSQRKPSPRNQFFTQIRLSLAQPDLACRPSSDIRRVRGPYRSGALEPAMRGIVISLAVGALLTLCGVFASAQETLLDSDRLADLAGTQPYRFPLPLPAG